MRSIHRIHHQRGSRIGTVGGVVLIVLLSGLGCPPDPSTSNRNTGPVADNRPVTLQPATPTGPMGPLLVRTLPFEPSYHVAGLPRIGMGGSGRSVLFFTDHEQRAVRAECDWREWRIVGPRRQQYYDIHVALVPYPFQLSNERCLAVGIGGSDDAFVAIFNDGDGHGSGFGGRLSQQRAMVYFDRFPQSAAVERIRFAAIESALSSRLFFATDTDVFLLDLKLWEELNAKTSHGLSQTQDANRPSVDAAYRHVFSGAIKALAASPDRLHVALGGGKIITLSSATDFAAPQPTSVELPLGAGDIHTLIAHDATTFTAHTDKGTLLKGTWHAEPWIGALPNGLLLRLRNGVLEAFRAATPDKVLARMEGFPTTPNYFGVDPQGQFVVVVAGKTLAVAALDLADLNY